MQTEWAKGSEGPVVKEQGEPRRLEVLGPEDKRISEPATCIEVSALVSVKGSKREPVVFLALDDGERVIHVEFNDVAHARSLAAGINNVADEWEKGFE